MVSTLLFFACLASSLASPSKPGLGPVPAIPVYNFPSTVQPENIYLRNNGQLLITSFSTPQIFQVDPNQGPAQQARLVHTFDGKTTVTGIVQLKPDVFAVAVGNYSATGASEKGTWGIWTVDLTNYQAPFYRASSVKVKKVVDSPQADLLDGLALVNPNVLASGDPTQGVIYNINLEKRTTTTLIADPLLKGMPAGSANDMLGVNGLKYRDSRVYLTNTGRDFYGYVPVDSSTGLLSGDRHVHVAYNYTHHLDDFNFGRKSGNAYLTTNDTPKPNAGIIRRKAGTPDGQSGSQLVVSYYGTNSVFADDQTVVCRLLFTSSIQSSVSKAFLPGPC